MSKVVADASFMELYGTGRIAAEAIDDFVDRWRELASKHRGMKVPIETFLGMTIEEYAAWVRDPSALPQIVSARLDCCGTL